MRVSFRTYLLVDGAAVKMPQKQFENVFIKNEMALPEYAGQTIQYVSVTYSVEMRKPKGIINMGVYSARLDKHGRNDVFYADNQTRDILREAEKRMKEDAPSDVEILDQLCNDLGANVLSTIMKDLFGETKGEGK